MKSIPVIGHLVYYKLGPLFDTSYSQCEQDYMCVRKVRDCVLRFAVFMVVIVKYGL